MPRDMESLPADCDALMEALCVLESIRPRPQLLSTVARTAGVAQPTRALESLLGRGALVGVEGDAQDPRIDFAKPADRHRIRGLITPTRWRTLHTAAAATVGPGPALAHRVAAADRPDETLARDLERVALGVTEADADADEAGDTEAHLDADADVGVPSSTLLEWAANLSPRPAGHEGRLLLAALHGVYEGESASGDLWARVEALPPSPLRSCALAGRAMLEDRRDDALGHLRQARAACEKARDPTRSAAAGAVVEHWSRGADAEAWFRAVNAVIGNVEAALHCRMAQGKDAVQTASRALADASADKALRRSLQRLKIDGSSYTRGPRFALDLLVQQPGCTADPPDEVHCDSDSLLLRGECRLLAGELDGSARDLHAVSGRDASRLPDTVRIRALERLVLSLFLLGRWRKAASAAADLTSAAGGRSAGPALQAMLAACRSEAAYARRSEERRALGAASGWNARTATEPDRIVIEAFAQAASALASVRPAEAAEALRPLAAGDAVLHDAPAKFRSIWLPLYAEALVEVGDRAAADALALLLEEAQRTRYLIVTVHRLAGRLAEQQRDRTAAGEHYESGLAVLEQNGVSVPPLHRAVLEHAYGRLLCAYGDSSSGSVWLKWARQHYSALGAVPFARRCADDARAFTVEDVLSDSESALTDQEARVARLAAAGLTNQQVADELRVSVKTVEYHLGKIYRKLGIRSRRQLT